MTRSSRTSTLLRRRAVWAVPVAAAAAVATVATLSSTSASGSVPDLPSRSAAQLLTALQTHVDTPLSGTVSETADLGLPSLPGTSGGASLSPQNFLTGTHSARVWADGPSKQRLALLGELSEADVVHNGSDVWTYTSDTNTVTHTTLTHRDDHADAMDALSPAAAAARVLKAITPTTSVSVDTARRVAGRAAYTLTIAPKSASSTVRRVTLAVDATTYVPLQLQVFGAASSPAFSLGYTDVSFATPAASTFDFHAPAGAKTSSNPLTTPGRRDHHAHAGRHAPAHARSTGSPHVLGSGWTSVLEVPADRTGVLDSQLVRKATTPVGSSGARLLHTALINVVQLPDGRAFIGAVTPSVLEHIATTTAR